jgi:hypothetical protein
MKHLFTVLSLIMAMLVIIVMDSDNYYNLTIPFVLILSLLIYQRFKEEKRELYEERFKEVQGLNAFKDKELEENAPYSCKLEDLSKFNGSSGWPGRKFIVGGHIIYAYTYDEAFNIYLKNFPH